MRRSDQFVVEEAATLELRPAWLTVCGPLRCNVQINVALRVPRWVTSSDSDT